MNLITLKHVCKFKRSLYINYFMNFFFYLMRDLKYYNEIRVRLWNLNEFCYIELFHQLIGLNYPLEIFFMWWTTSLFLLYIQYYYDLKNFKECGTIEWNFKNFTIITPFFINGFFSISVLYRHRDHNNHRIMIKILCFSLFFVLGCTWFG